jgi:hypothetical protein
VQVQGGFTLQADCSTKINAGLLNAAKRTIANLNNISEKLIEKVEARRTEQCLNVRLLEAASSTATAATAATAAAAAAGDASTSGSITVTYAIAFSADTAGAAAAQRTAAALSTVTPAVLLAGLQQAALTLKADNPSLDVDVSGVTGATASEPVVVSVAATTASPTAAPAKRAAAKKHTGAIIGGVIGGVAALLLLSGVGWWASLRHVKQLQTVSPVVTAAVASPTGVRAAAVPANAVASKVTAAAAVAAAAVVPAAAAAAASAEGL